MSAFKTLINIFTTKSVKFTIAIDACTPEYESIAILSVIFNLDLLESKPDICNFRKVDNRFLTLITGYKILVHDAAEIQPLNRY